MYTHQGKKLHKQTEKEKERNLNTRVILTRKKILEYCHLLTTLHVPSRRRYVWQIKHGSALSPLCKLLTWRSFNKAEKSCGQGYPERPAAQTVKLAQAEKHKMEATLTSSQGEYMKLLCAVWGEHRCLAKSEVQEVQREKQSSKPSQEESHHTPGLQAVEKGSRRFTTHAV